MMESARSEKDKIEVKGVKKLGKTASGKDKNEDINTDILESDLEEEVSDEPEKVEGL